MTTKIVLLGPSGVGKSALIHNLNNGYFCNEVDSTIGCQFVRIRKDDLIFDIWDTAGQERYMSITPTYFRNADIVIFVFDVTDIRSIDSMTKFVDLYYGTCKSSNAKILIVGNKMDKDHISQHVLLKELETNNIINKCNLQEIVPIFTSAKNNTGIQILLNRIIEYAIEMKPKINNTIKLETKNTQSKCYWCV